MAYLNMNSRITIGNKIFPHVSSFEITESVTDISNKATIVMPRGFRDENNKYTADYIKTGERVIIQAGYNGDLKTEYIGYVSQSPTADIPVEIECDELFPLRQGNILKSYRTITLLRLLREHITGYTIEAPDVELGKVFLDHVSPYRMLEDLRRNFGFYTKIIDGNKLVVGWAYDWSQANTNIVKYQFGKNIKSAGSLKFKHKTDFNTRVKVIVNLPGGLKEEVEFGSTSKDAAVSTETVAGISKEAASSIAKARYTAASYDGFEGSVKGFGFPVLHAGDSVEFTSTKYPERNGRYLGEKVTIRYSESGFERETKIGFRL